MDKIEKIQSFDEYDEFVTKLGIDQPGEVINGKFIIPLMTSDEYSLAYTKLDKSDLVELDTSSTLVTDKVSELTYIGGGMKVQLDANFPDDFYRVVVSKE